MSPTDRRIDPDGAQVGSWRPAGPAEPPDRPCPFCLGGLEAPEPYDVKAFTNRWPSLPDDRCEVVLYTADHDATFAVLGRAGARRVVDLWAERTAALGARDDVAYVLVFENRGPEVGATIAHPHGQIYAYDEVPPPRPRAGAATARRCASRHPPSSWSSRAAAGGPGCRAAADLALRAARRARRRTVPDLPSLDDAERDGLAAVLVDALGRLDRLFDAPMPYMFWIHQRPFDGGDWPTAQSTSTSPPSTAPPGTPASWPPPSSAAASTSTRSTPRTRRQPSAALTP